MRMSSHAHLAVALALGTIVLSLDAAGGSLNVGDFAPRLQSGKFVQGDSVKELKPGTAYIIEFWATWCVPCRASIPHLNDIYTKFKDKGLVVIGQDCWETDEAKVVPFVKSMGEKMAYRVALDDKEGNDKGKMAETWMEAAGQKGIPSAFLIDKTRHIAWIGQPMSLREDVIEAVLADKFEAKDLKEKAAAEQAQEAAVENGFTKYHDAMRDKNWDAAMASLDELEKAAPKGHNAILTMRVEVLVNKKDFTEALEAVNKLADANISPNRQNGVAWTIVTGESMKDPGLLSAAETMARRAVDGAKDDAHKSMFIDTLARVTCLKGKTGDAIALEQKALALASDSGKARCQRTLDSYKKGELPLAE